jgi:hypothetical protein
MKLESDNETILKTFKISICYIFSHLVTFAKILYAYAKNMLFIFIRLLKYCIPASLCLFASAHCFAQHFNYENDYPAILKRTQAKNDSLNYSVLLPKFLKNDSSLSVYETLCLMIGYSGLPVYKPFNDIKTERLLIQLNDSAKYETVLKICDTFLATHPLNQGGIIEKAYAYYKLNRNDSAAFYKEQFARIMATMDWSNDGRTPETAMFALGPDDGKNFADKYYHAEAGNTSTIINNYGNYCSSVEIIYKKEGKQKSAIFYFVLQHAANTTASKQ